MIRLFPFDARSGRRGWASALGGLAALTIGACDSRGPAGEAASTTLPDPSLDPSLSAGASVADPAELKARAEAAVAAALMDSDGALYSNIRSGAGGAICGEVYAREPGRTDEGPKPFVVLPQGAAIVSATSRLAFENADDPFPDAYIQWCATPEELKRLEPKLAKAASAGHGPGGEDLSAREAEAGLDAPVDLPPELPSLASKPGEATGQQAADEGRIAVGSLGNAVRRKRTAAPGQ